MSAADLELGYAGAKVYAGFAEGARFAVLLFRADSPELVAVLEADKLGQLRTGAASGVAARHLAARSAARNRRAASCAFGCNPRMWRSDRSSKRPHTVAIVLVMSSRRASASSTARVHTPSAGPV